MSASAIAQPGKNIAPSKPRPAAPVPKKAEPEPTSSAPDIMKNLAAQGGLSIMTDLIKRAGLSDAIRTGEYTVMAPTDAAFANLPAGKLDELRKPENKEALKALITAHLLPTRVNAARLAQDSASPKTIRGCSFKVQSVDGSLTVGNDRGMFKVSRADIICSNGVIHQIDGVMLSREPNETKRSASPKQGDGTGRGETNNPKPAKPADANMPASPIQTPPKEPAPAKDAEPTKKPTTDKPSPVAPK